VESANETVSDINLPRIGEPLVRAFHPTPDNPPWNSLIAVGVFIASVLAIIIVPTIVVLPYVVSQGPGFGDNQALGGFLQQDPWAIILQMVAIIPAHLLTLAVAWAVVTRARTFSFRESLGWETGGMKWWHHVVILGAFFAIAIVVGNYFPEQENELTRILKSSRYAVFIIAFMATFTAPLVEEVIYRGLLYSAFQRTLGVGPGVAAVTLLFALVHVPQYYPSYSTIFLLLLLSLTLTAVRAVTGNLWPCIVLHTVFNATQSILLILEPYISTEVPIVEPTTGFFLR
jgi:membrane protease YdiL (CAAX protease family)